MHFSLFSFIFNYFHGFLDFNKHEQNSWFQIMEFVESIHAELIRTLVGGSYILDIFSDIDSKGDYLVFD